MAVLTSITDIVDDGINQKTYNRNLQERAQVKLLHNRFAVQTNLDQGSGTRVTFRRYNRLALALTPLGSTVKQGQKKSAVTFSGTIKWYGDYITEDFKYVLTGIDPRIVVNSDLLGDQMGETADVVLREVYTAGTNVRYSNAVTARSSVATTITNNDINSAVRDLRAAGSTMIADAVSPSTNVNTHPVPRGWYALGHTDCEQDYRALSNFLSFENYGKKESAFEDCEEGSKGKVRFLTTTNGKIFESSGAAVGSTGLLAVDDTNIDVYTTLIFSANAVACTKMKKDSAKLIVKDLGSAGSLDPLGQFATTGWKLGLLGKILNQQWLKRIEHGVSEI